MTVRGAGCGGDGKRWPRLLSEMLNAEASIESRTGLDHPSVEVYLESFYVPLRLAQHSTYPSPVPSRQITY